jgi:MoxR-like ATPase
MSLSETAALVSALQKELRRVIVGQDEVVNEILIAFLAGGHCLLRGVPGLAKTLLIKTLADAVDLRFSRIQFTPDLMPSDIIGTEVIEEDRASGARSIRFVPGPVFANIILADEINRTPPKTQAALLEAMQEYQVTVGGVRHQLERPLFVLATQNPIEQEGTYPLPEAQLDRFMLNVVIGYPTAADERKILAQTTTGEEPKASAVATGAQIEQARLLVREVVAAENVIEYAARLVRATRPPSRPEAAATYALSATADRSARPRLSSPGSERAAAGPTGDDGDCVPDFITQWVRWGAGPRAGQSLLLAGKARAVLNGRPAVSLEDVRAVAPPVLRHRVLVNFQAEADGIDAEQIVSQLLEAVRP